MAKEKRPCSLHSPPPAYSSWRRNRTHDIFRRNLSYLLTQYTLMAFSFSLSQVVSSFQTLSQLLFNACWRCEHDRKRNNAKKINENIAGTHARTEQSTKIEEKLLQATIWANNNRAWWCMKKTNMSYE